MKETMKPNIAELLNPELVNDRFTCRCMYEDESLHLEMDNDTESMLYWDANSFSDGNILLALKRLPSGVYLAWMFDAEGWSWAKVNTNPKCPPKEAEANPCITLYGWMTDDRCMPVEMRENLSQGFTDTLDRLLLGCSTDCEEHRVELGEILDQPDIACFIERVGKRKRRVGTWVRPTS